jgi:hypothetical protein
MINWNVIPFNFANPYPYTLWSPMEWIGKHSYMLSDIDTRVTTAETNISSIQDTLDTLPTTYATINYVDTQDNAIKQDLLDNYVPMDAYNALYLDYNRFKNSINKESKSVITSVEVPEYTDTENARQYRFTALTDYDYITIQFNSNLNYSAVLTIKLDGSDVCNHNIFVVPLVVGEVHTNTYQATLGYIPATNEVIISMTHIYNYDGATNEVTETNVFDTINSITATYFSNPTYTPTEDEKTTLYHRANVTGSGEISSSDGAIVKEFYAAHQANPSVYPQSDAGFTAWYTAKYGSAPTYGLLPDINGDGLADSSDVALILKFYAEVQAGNYTNNIDDFWRFING